MKKEDKQFYIQNGWVGNAMLWWATNRQGYTTEINKAGRYTYQEAKNIILRPEDRAWECNYIDKCLEARKIIIDSQYLDKKKCIKGNKK